MKRPLCILCGVLILCIVLFIRGFPSHIPETEIYDGRELVLTGEIIRKEQTTVIYLKSVQAADIYSQTLPLQGGDSQEKKENNIKGIICYLKEEGADSYLRIGERITVKGRFQALQRPGNPGEFDAALNYYAQGFSGKLFQAEVLSGGGEYSKIREALYRLQSYLEGCIDRGYDSEDAKLLKAILLGSKSDINSELKELYQRSGIIHILSISGLHISILGMGLYSILRRLTVRVTPAVIISFLFLVLYGIMAGSGISIVRAVGMFGIKGLGKIWGRTYDLVTALSFMGLLLLIEQPLYVYHSGYWLSFGSVAGIAVIYPILKELISFDRFEGGRKPAIQKGCQIVTQAFLSGMSVTIMTAPIMLWFYYEIPVFSVFINLLVIPIMTVLMVLGVINLSYLAVVCGFLPPVFLLPAKGIGSIHHLIFELFEGLCLFSQKLPGHTVTAGKPAFFQILLFYICLWAVLSLLKSAACVGNRKNRSAGKPDLYLRGCKRKRYGAAACLAAGAFFILFFRGSTGFSVAALDVGQGNAGVILYKSAAFIIDAGSSSRKNTGKNVLIPYLKYHGISKVEAAFVTHPDADHYNGVLELIEEANREGITINRLILPEICREEVQKGQAMRQLIQTAEFRDIPVVYFSKGMQLKKDELTICCLHPDGEDYGEDSNSYSQVLLIKYHLFSMLFMGDAQGEAEAAALEAMQEMQTGQATALMAGHHGSKYASLEALLSYLNPRFTVISCGKNNRYGHPHYTVLERLEEAGSEALITWLTGAVIVSTDGKSMEIKKFRESFP